MNSCFLNSNLKEQTIFEMLFEFLLVFCSVYPYILGFYFLIIPIVKKTARNMILNAMFILSTIGCEILKRLFKQPRPEGSCSQGHGFPSSHAGLAGFLVTLFIAEYLITRSKSRQFSNKWHYGFQKVFVFFTSPLVLYSRWYLNYHNEFQIAIGFLIGVVSAIIVSSLAFYQLDSQNSFFSKLLTKLKFQNDYSVEEKQLKSKDQ
ncbi:hypothetical protein ABPG72_003412 [Tetrahymena utriculariae]